MVAGSNFYVDRVALAWSSDISLDECAIYGLTYPEIERECGEQEA
jgi:hypothetical protein